MALIADTLLRPFRRLQQREDAISRDEVTALQSRIEQSVNGLVAFARQVAGPGCVVFVDLTAAQLAQYFETSGRGAPGGPWEGWSLSTTLADHGTAKAVVRST